MRMHYLSTLYINQNQIYSEIYENSHIPLGVIFLFLIMILFNFFIMTIIINNKYCILLVVNMQLYHYLTINEWNIIRSANFIMKI